MVQYALLPSLPARHPLHIIFDALWQMIVNDGPYIALIEPHAKRDGGHNQLEIARHKPRLNVTFVTVHAPMICPRVKPFRV